MFENWKAITGVTTTFGLIWGVVGAVLNSLPSNYTPDVNIIWLPSYLATYIIEFYFGGPLPSQVLGTQTTVTVLWGPLLGITLLFGFIIGLLIAVGISLLLEIKKLF